MFSLFIHICNFKEVCYFSGFLNNAKCTITMCVIIHQDSNAENANGLSKSCGKWKEGCTNLRAYNYFSAVKRFGLLMIFPHFAALFQVTHVLWTQAVVASDHVDLVLRQGTGIQFGSINWKWETSILCLFAHSYSTITIWSCKRR